MKYLFYVWMIIVSIASSIASSEPIWFGNTQAERSLTIYSAVDLDAFEPLLKQFVVRNPELKVAYLDINTLALYHQVIAEQAQPIASLVISSAMDLQLKLVNDGLAQTYQSPSTEALPAMAKWRNQIFAFSLEPVVMLVNQTLFPGGTLPEDRQAVLQSIRQFSDHLDGKIGTYDIRTSGVGYLLASQDARQADATWGRLLEAFGSHNVQTYCCTRDIIDDVATGKLVLGYNLLGSYAHKRALSDPRLTMIMPSDYTLLLMRVALIPKFAPNVDDAGLFLDFLLSQEGQTMMLSEDLLFPIQASENGKNSLLKSAHPTRIIELDQQLLVGRDVAKQTRFIENWEFALELAPER